jgi:membrane fusion protein (multidrug efflux system)
MKHGSGKHWRPGRSEAFTLLSILICAFMILPLVTGCGKRKTPAMPTPSVSVTPVVQRDVPLSFEWVSTLDGNVNAVIRAQVQGYLVRQCYREGDFVKQGQVLFEIDPRTFQAAYDEARAQVALNQARWEKARSNLSRVRPLAAQNALSQKDLDDAVASEKESRAAVETSKAELDKARLNLGFTKITSPIDGIAGIAKAQIGNLVSPQSSDELTTVSQVNPIKAYISISEKEYLNAAQYTRGNFKDARIELILANGSVYPHKGMFSVVDRQIDLKTGTMKVEALFPNPDSLLRPGQFAKVHAVLATLKNAMVIPQKAVTELQGQIQVGVVTPDKKVDIRTVKTGQKFGDLVVVLEGLRPGEQVVVEGTQKLKQGITVNPTPFSGQATGSGQPPAPASAPVPSPSGKE